MSETLTKIAIISLAILPESYFAIGIVHGLFLTKAQRGVDIIGGTALPTAVSIRGTDIHLYPTKFTLALLVGGIALTLIALAVMLQKPDCLWGT